MNNNSKYANTTQTPNEILDYWMPILSPTAFKILAFIIRKTKGWHKDSDILSISQFCKGTGLTRTTVRKAIKQLLGEEDSEFYEHVKRNPVIKREKTFDSSPGFETFCYTIIIYKSNDLWKGKKISNRAKLKSKKLPKNTTNFSSENEEKRGVIDGIPLSQSIPLPLPPPFSLENEKQRGAIVNPTKEKEIYKKKAIKESECKLNALPLLSCEEEEEGIQKKKMNSILDSLMQKVEKPVELLDRSLDQAIEKINPPYPKKILDSDGTKDYLRKISLQVGVELSEKDLNIWFKKFGVNRTGKNIEHVIENNKINLKTRSPAALINTAITQNWYMQNENTKFNSNWIEQFKKENNLQSLIINSQYAVDKLTGYDFQFKIPFTNFQSMVLKYYKNIR